MKPAEFRSVLVRAQSGKTLLVLLKMMERWIQVLPAFGGNGCGSNHKVPFWDDYPPSVVFFAGLLGVH